MDKKLRVLAFSTAYLPLIGGAEIAVREITDRLPDAEVHLICARLQKGLPSREMVGRVQVHRVGFGIPFDKYALPFLGVWRAFQIEKVNLVWAIMASYGGIAARFYSCFHPRTRLLLTIQEGDPPERYAKRLGALGFLQRALFRRADAIQTISTFLSDWAKKSGALVEPTIIPNGVDVGRFSKHLPYDERAQLRTKMGFSSDEIVLISVSRLSHKNGMDLLVESLSSLPQSIKLLLIGGGEQEAALRERVQALGLVDRVRFHGEVGHDELPGLLQASDIFVRPSRSEGLGNAFLEGMASGIPVIGTPVGGIPDFLKEGETGFLAEPENASSVADAVKRCLAIPSEKRKEILERAKQLVATGYTWDGVAKKMGTLMEKTATAQRFIVATGIYPPEIGGAATGVLMEMLVREVRSRGVLVRVFTYGNFDGRDVDVTATPRKGSVIWRYLSFFWKLRKELRPNDEILATDVFSVGIPTRLALIGKRNSLIVRLGGEWCWEDAVNRGAWVTLKQFWTQPDTLRRKLMRWNYWWILGRANQTIVTSELLKTTLEQHIFGSKKYRMIIENKVHLQEQKLSYIELHSVPRLIYVGRFAPVKNLPFLARVLRRLYVNNIKFEMKFVGSGETEESVKHELEGIPSIKFLGALPLEQAWEQISQSDVLLLPSLSDMYPNVVYEALRFGKPCFITSENGLEPGTPGLHLLDPQDEDAWVKALGDFLRDHDKTGAKAA